VYPLKPSPYYATAVLERLRLIRPVAELAKSVMVTAASSDQESAIQEVLDERLPHLLEALDGTGRRQRGDTARMLYAVGGLSVVDAHWVPRTVVPRHSHAWTAVATREGECRFTLADGTVAALQEGQWLFLPTGIEHTLEIPSPEGARTVHICGWKISRATRGMARAP
jgi:quercetin dioxygenase-like cupin family protein